MTTKLVYTLTCAPDKHYIEQCLMAVFSARHYNPDATIVLIVDDKTDALFVGKRAELLNYITEKIVVPFEDESLSPMYRSRWLKTSVRRLVDGDILFVDCDTICHKSLAEIDNFDCELAMVPDEHLPVEEYHYRLKLYLQSNSKKLDFDVLNEKYYYNSGVIYAKDTLNVRTFWEHWHKEWLGGEKKGVKVDQTSLCKAGILFKMQVSKLPDIWNTMVYMSPSFVKEAKILHFWQFRNRSFMYCEPFLNYVEKHGVDRYVKEWVLNPLESMLPSNNVFYQDSWSIKISYIKQISYNLILYQKLVDRTFKDFPWKSHVEKEDDMFLKKGLFNAFEIKLLTMGFFKTLSVLYVIKRIILLFIKRADNTKYVYFT